jgi:hypothetical protein
MARGEPYVVCDLEGRPVAPTRPNASWPSASPQRPRSAAGDVRPSRRGRPLTRRSRAQGKSQREAGQEATFPTTSLDAHPAASTPARLRDDPETRAYASRRTTDGKSPRDVRCCSSGSSPGSCSGSWNAPTGPASRCPAGLDNTSSLAQRRRACLAWDRDRPACVAFQHQPALTQRSQKWPLSGRSDFGTSNHIPDMGVRKGLKCSRACNRLNKYLQTGQQRHRMCWFPRRRGLQALVLGDVPYLTSSATMAAIISAHALSRR